MYNLGVLYSCASNPLRYCPTEKVTRIEALRNILRAKYGPSYVPPEPSHYFADMNGDALEAWADQAYRDGITSGCSSNPRNFCPNNTVTRTEIVIFLLRAEHGSSYSPPAPSHYFADMNGNSSEAWADQAYRENISMGCSSNPRNFCPTATMGRDSMAVFLENTFHLVQPPPAFSYRGTWRKYYFAGTSRVAMRQCGGSGETACTGPMFFLTDHLGSTSVMVASNEAELSRMLYKPWGQLRYSSSSSAALPTQYTYTGQFSYMDDPITTGASEGFGLMYYNARFYSPYINHFIQPDTIIPDQTNPQSWDRYSYVTNNPVRYTDPTGHIRTDEQCGVYSEQCDHLGASTGWNGKVIRRFTKTSDHTGYIGKGGQSSTGASGLQTVQQTLGSINYNLGPNGVTLYNGPVLAGVVPIGDLKISWSPSLTLNNGGPATVSSSGITYVPPPAPVAPRFSMTGNGPSMGYIDSPILNSPALSGLSFSFPQNAQFNMSVTEILQTKSISFVSRTDITYTERPDYATVAAAPVAIGSFLLLQAQKASMGIPFCPNGVTC